MSSERGRFSLRRAEGFVSSERGRFSGFAARFATRLTTSATATIANTASSAPAPLTLPRRARAPSRTSRMLAIHSVAELEEELGPATKRRDGSCAIFVTHKLLCCGQRTWHDVPSYDGFVHVHHLQQCHLLGGLQKGNTSDGNAKKVLRRSPPTTPTH